MISTISEMRNHPLYDRYSTQVDARHTYGESSSIYKISIPSFEEFIKRYDNDLKFKRRTDDMYKKRSRELKIDQLGM